LVLDSTILENIPMESNHQLNRNITLSDVSVEAMTENPIIQATKQGLKRASKHPEQSASKRRTS
jgi:hypothetical protein